MNIRIGVISLEVWNIKDMINMTANTGHSLNQFSKYSVENKTIARGERYDAAALITLVINH